MRRLSREYCREKVFTTKNFDDMEQISLVTARVVRRNAQYAYKLVGKGEQYLVRHEDGDNAGDKVLEYLAPYAAEPVTIEAVRLEKNVEFLNAEDVRDQIYKCTIEYVTLNEKMGKETKVRRSRYVYANSCKEAIDVACELEAGCVTSVSLTKIIELL